MIIPYFIHVFSFYRLISLILGLILLITGLCLKSKSLVYKIPLYLVLLLITLLSLDFISCKLFKGIPIISFKVESAEGVVNYNSLFFRIYSCDNNYTIDSYDKNYLCSEDALPVIPINKFLENPLESFQKYHHKFVKLEGKIGSITGTSSITLNAYTSAEEVKNGYVTFDLEKGVKAEELNIDPTKYYNYDYVDIIGLVESIDKEKNIIYLKDAIVSDNHIYDSYEVIVNNINSYDAVKSGDIYYLGISSIFYKYREDILYELDYLLSDKRESINNLIKDAKEEIINDNDKLYKLEDYQIILCNNQNTLFVNKDINNYNDICNISEN